MSRLILLIGGARSGKSHHAQELAVKSGGWVLFVATAEARDDEMRQRIAAHRKARPAAWRTLEAATHIGPRIMKEIGHADTVIVDCITLLVNNIFMACSGPTSDHIDSVTLEKDVVREISELIEYINKSNATFIVVTNEVGLGLVPDNQMGRLYRDLLGKANQMLAQRADEVYLMVAGIPVTVKSI